MSGYISGAVWLSGPKHHNQRMVLLAIADNANDSGYAYPAVDLIVQKCLISKRTVIYCLAELVNGGWLEVNKKAIGHKGNSYQIVLDRLSFERPKSGAIAALEKKSGANGDMGQVQLIADSGANGDIAIRKNCQELSKEPSIGLPEWVPLNSWVAFVEMRQKLRKPLTNKAKELVINRLDGFRKQGHNVEEMLNESTVKCWLTVFPHDNHRNGSGTRQEAPSRTRSALDEIRDMEKRYGA